MDKVPIICGKCSFGRSYGSKVICLKLKKMVDGKSLYPGCPLKFIEVDSPSK